MHVDIENRVSSKEQAIADRFAFYYHLPPIISVSLSHSIFFSFLLPFPLFPTEGDYILLSVIISQLLSFLPGIDHTEHPQVDRSI